jgi:hypothetical protein
MASSNIISLATLAKTAVASTDYFQVQGSTTSIYKKIGVQSLFPSMATSGSGSESIWVSTTNGNQLNFKGIKSGDTDLLTVTTDTNNIVLTALEAGIDLSLCNNTTSGFLTAMDFTGTASGECGVTNGGTGLATIAKGAMLYASDTDTIAATAAMSTNGQLLIGNASTGIPTLATLTAGTGITITNGAGSISLAATIANASANIDLYDGSSVTYNIDTNAGAGWLSNDGADGGLTVAASNKAYIGASGAAQYDGILNLGGNLTFVNTVTGTIKPQATTSTTVGKHLKIYGGGSDNATAGNLELYGGTPGSSNNAGGDVKIYAGDDTGSGVAGDIEMYVYDGSNSAVQALTVTGGDASPDVTVNAGNVIMSAGAPYMRSASYPQVIKYQGNQATTDDGTTAVTAANILTGIVECTPTADRSKATDTASNLISGLGLLADNDAFDFSFINLTTDGQDNVTLTGGTGVSLVGNMVIHAQDAADDAVCIGVGRFIIRRTGSSAVTMYRIG